MSVGRLIRSEEDVAEGAQWLARRCPRLRHALHQTGAVPLRRRPDGFPQLLSAIISQQVSVASASAIWSRLEAAGMTTPDAVQSVGDEALREIGLSRQKARYAAALAVADIDYDALRGQPDEEVIATLVKVPGIGPWTAQIYAMFSLGRADVFAPGDLALQEAVRLLYQLEARPTEKQLQLRAAEWSPWRAVAARLLFAYYRIEKQREGVS